MAALTSERDTVQVARGARTLGLPVKAGVTIYQGALVAVGADGYAVPAKKAENLKAAGRAEETVDNRDGTDGGAVVCVSRGDIYLGKQHREPGGSQRPDGPLLYGG